MSSASAGPLRRFIIFDAAVIYSKTLIQLPIPVDPVDPVDSIRDTPITLCFNLSDIS